MNIKQKVKNITMLVLLLTLTATAGAQVYYHCDFENDTQNASWKLNGAKNNGIYAGPNLWYIGTPGDFSPSDEGKGLYISSDGGNSPIYYSAPGGNMMFVAAYDTLTLAPGAYSLDFDWRLMGNGASAKLYVAWLPRTQSVNSADVGASAVITTNNNIDSDERLYGKRYWTPQRYNFNVTQATSVGKLVFVFVIATPDRVKGPSACVDNIEIHAQSNCASPRNVTYNESEATLSWSGGNGTYQMRDYCVYEERLVIYDSIDATSVALALDGEGTHTFYVRKECGEGQYSEWISTQAFVWIPGARCLDYMDLNNPDVCTCFTGTASSGGPNDYNAFKKSGSPVSGPVGDWAKGRHTMHTNPEETDPNTDNMLPTVPDGELLSIRLGNSTTGGEAEGIIYKMTIPKGESRILKLKYALVLEDGGHDAGGPEAGQHGGNEQSHFYVEIRDQNGKPQGAGCSTFDFSCDPNLAATDPTWHTYNPTGGSYGSVVWKEWTEVSISLVAFQGQTIQIRLSNYDCTAGGHYGYAYFAMGCVDGGLQGVACGDFTTDHFDAPEGFNYRWYAADDPKKVVLSEDRTFEISPETDSIYLVDVINPINDCFYTLTANPNPRFPMAKADTSLLTRNCQHNMTFNNKSVVRVVNRKDGSTMSVDEPIYKCVYDYGDGVVETRNGTSVTHTYPSTGGHFVAKVIASMSDGMCTDTISFEFDLPDILHTGTDEYVSLCRKTTPTYTLPDGGITSNDTVYISYIPNQYGCEAPYYMHVQFSDQIDVNLKDTICEGQYRVFDGDTLTTTDVYTKRYSLPTGCDSVVALDLYVIPHMEFNVPDTIEICGDNGVAIHIPFELGVGRDQYLGVDVRFDSLGIAHGFDSVYTFAPGEEIVIRVPDSIWPNYYPVVLHPHTPQCPVETHDVTAVIHYSNMIFDQLAGFVGLLNDRYNYGGFEYLRYRWYRDGELMPNDTLSYIHTTDADLEHEYTVELLRTPDSVLITSCPVVYTGRPMAVDNVADGCCVSPTLLTGGSNMTVVGRGTVRVIDLLGRVHETLHMPGTVNSAMTVPAPTENGVYFVIFENRYAVKIIVR